MSRLDLHKFLNLTNKKLPKYTCLRNDTNTAIIGRRVLMVHSVVDGRGMLVGATLYIPNTVVNH